MAPIAREIKQSKPFSSAAEEAAVSLLRTADLVRRNIDAVFEPYDITTQQYNVLRILRGAGSDGLPTLEIAERMIEQAPGITRLIDRLEAKELVERERCTKDRRRVWCRITPAGTKLLESLDKPVAASAESLFRSVNKRLLADFVSKLDAVREGLNAATTKEEVS